MLSSTRRSSRCEREQVKASSLTCEVWLLLQSKLQELEAEAAAMRVRRAQQLPASVKDQPAVPPKPEPKPLTVPNPFRLRSEVGRARVWVCGLGCLASLIL